jgi:hypothetical protein
VVITIRHFTYTCKQQTFSKMLNVINSEIVRKTATHCTMKIITFIRIKMCTVSMLVTFTAKLDTTIPTEA